ncbi:MAG: 6-phosphogluconolactonase, partial [Actinomycetota bacterium]
MAFKVEVFEQDHAEQVARRVVEALPGGGSLVLTGGTTAEKIYPRLAGKKDWSQVTFAFSDERCVPPDAPESNYGMVKRLFLDAIDPGPVHRMKGELTPERAAAEYDSEIRHLVHQGFDLMLLGMGADAHIGALSPGSPALASDALCAPVDRPDGLKGLTLTPPAILSARKILLIVTGEAKAETVKRAIEGNEPVERCPVRL